MTGHVDARPVFVTGPDRSGTTLMYSLLASHPNISMVRRTNLWRWFYGRFGDLGEAANLERCLSSLMSYQRLDILAPDPDRLRREFTAGSDRSYGRLFALLHQHHAERVGKPRWGDKSLHTELRADDVFTEFPRAKMIHMLRDPRDRHASVSKRYDEAQKGIGAATGRWLTSTRRARRNLRRHPDRYLVVRYETLASAPEQICREVCEFLGEEYTPQMLAMTGAPDRGDAGGNSSFESIAAGTISTRSIGRFREVLGSREIAFIQACTRREMTAFGYDKDRVPFSTRERVAFATGYLPVNFARLHAWRARDAIGEARGRGVPEHRRRTSPAM